MYFATLKVFSYTSNLCIRKLSVIMVQEKTKICNLSTCNNKEKLYLCIVFHDYGH